MSDMFDYVRDLPGLFIAKDNQSRYINISQTFAQLLGWKSALESAGKTDYDIPCRAVEFASEFIKLDKKVIDTKEKMVALDIQNYVSGWKLVLVERNPITLENNDKTGLFNHCIDISGSNLFNHYFNLHQADNKIFGKSYKPVSYILNRKHSPLNLTTKQENCLFLLVRGKSSREIAKILSLSPRTVETHIENLKTKLGCQYKSDLIEKTIDSGFVYYVPESMQNYRLGQCVS